VALGIRWRPFTNLLKVMESKYGIQILDRELACAPPFTPEGQAYFLRSAALICHL